MIAIILEEEDSEPFVPMEEFDPDLEETFYQGFAESERKEDNYLPLLPITMYTSGDTSPDPLDEITSSVPTLPNHIYATYVPHESENRHFSQLPQYMETDSNLNNNTFLQRLRRSVSAADLLNNNEQIYNTAVLNTQRMNEEALLNNFVPTAPQVAEFLQALGVKVPAEAKLSDGRPQSTPNKKNARQKFNKTVVRKPYKNNTTSPIRSSKPIAVVKTNLPFKSKDQPLAISAETISEIENYNPVIYDHARNISEDSSQEVRAVQQGLLTNTIRPVVASKPKSDSQFRGESEKLLKTGKLSLKKSTSSLPPLANSVESNRDALLRRAQEDIFNLQKQNDEIEQGYQDVIEDINLNSNVQNVQAERETGNQYFSPTSHKNNNGTNFHTTKPVDILNNQNFRQELQEVVREIATTDKEILERDIERKVEKRLTVEFENKQIETNKALIKDIVRRQREVESQFLNS